MPESLPAAASLLRVTTSTLQDSQTRAWLSCGGPKCRVLCPRTWSAAHTTNQNNSRVWVRYTSRQPTLCYCTRIDVSVLPLRSTCGCVHQSGAETSTRARRRKIDLAACVAAIVDRLPSLSNRRLTVIGGVARRQQRGCENRVIDLTEQVHASRGINTVAKVSDLGRLDVRRFESLRCRTCRRIGHIRRRILDLVTTSDGPRRLSASAGGIETGHARSRRQKLFVDRRSRLLADNLRGLPARHVGTRVNVLLGSQLLPDKILAARGHTCC